MGYKRILKILFEVKKAGWLITREQREEIEEEFEKWGYREINENYIKG